MLRRQRQSRAQLQKLIDAIVFGVSFWLAHLVRAAEIWNVPVLRDALAVLGGIPEIRPFSEYIWLLVIIMPVTPFLLEVQGFYNRPIIASRHRTVWQLAKVCTLVAIVTIMVLFLRKEFLGRAVIILFPSISMCLMMLKEELIRRWFRTSVGQAQMNKRLILLGTPEDTVKISRQLGSSKDDAIEIVAELDLNNTTNEQLVDFLHSHSANGVILCAKHTYFGQIEKAIQACELEGVEVWLLADFFNTQVAHTTLDEFYGSPVLVFRSTPEDSWQAVAKHVIDFIGAAILLAVLGLPMLALMALIRVTSPGPVFFRQQRSGLNGRPFTMLKFRSMVTNAEQLKQELAALNEMSGPVFKVSNDPRITPVGRFLRKYSLDELPQLINVLRGEMSLVGPRPLPVDEVRRFDDLAHRRRLSVKPGLTCLWQISGRNEVKDFKDWVRLDLEYIDNWSIWLDLKILIRTVPVVLAGTGAR
ncbi:MAG: sugar transferase [Pedosphaera sp.]|nr:sugar transferase [Pedosphaera sp.]